MSGRRLRTFVVVGCLGMLAAACGGQSADDQTVATPPGGAPTSQGEDCDPATAKVPSEGKPAIEIPDGAPPSTLQIDDIKAGDGRIVPPGANVMIHYVGVGWNTKQEFDSSWDARPVVFPLAGLIKGWQEGIPGMKVGGRRQLTIPGDKAYGPNPPPGPIQPNETLVFVVDMIAVCASS